MLPYQIIIVTRRVLPMEQDIFFYPTRTPEFILVFLVRFVLLNRQVFCAVFLLIIAFLFVLFLLAITLSVLLRLRLLINHWVSSDFPKLLVTLVSNCLFFSRFFSRLLVVFPFIIITWYSNSCLRKESITHINFPNKISYKLKSSKMYSTNVNIVQFFKTDRKETNKQNQQKQTKQTKTNESESVYVFFQCLL